MPIFLQDIYDRRQGVDASLPHDEKDFPANFPLNRWTQQLQHYLTYWQHFTGEWLEQLDDQQTDDEGNPVFKYPLKINYIKTACLKQLAVLFGEVGDNSTSMVEVKINPRRSPRTSEIPDEARWKAKELENVLNGMWAENDGGPLQQEGGLISQFLGGTVFGARWRPDDPELEYHVAIENILPDFWMPIYNSGKPHDLLEAWIAWRIPAREAQIRFGWEGGAGQNDPLYIEHWTKTHYTITIGATPIQTDEMSYENSPNPFGFIPFVYIPRRRVGNYYGLSIVDDLEALEAELNTRVADMGDIIRETAQRDTYLSNVRNVVKSRDIGAIRNAIDLGSNGPNEPEPKAFTIQAPTMSEAVAKFPSTLSEQFSNDSSVPPIAYGVDEGSQRSALTLAVRFWPLTAEARQQRVHWRAGLKRFAWMLAKIAVLKGVGGITPAHMENIEISTKWSPMIPRDSELQLNTINTLMAQWAIDPETALTLMDFVDDPEDVVAKAKVFFAWKAKQEGIAAAGPQDAGASTSSNNSEIKKPSAKPQK